MTSLYFVYMLVQILLVRQLYSILKTHMPPVARATNCHIFVMKLIIFLHLSLRIVMNSLSDSSSKVQAYVGQQISWVYILLGDAITEILSAFGMVLLCTITFKFEALAKTYLIQYCNHFILII